MKWLAWCVLAVLLALLSAAACGARTSLDLAGPAASTVVGPPRDAGAPPPSDANGPLDARAETTAPDGGAADDAGAVDAGDTGLPPPPAACVASSPPGTLAWQVTLDAGSGEAGYPSSFAGPFAADSTGTTYFVGSNPAMTGVEVVAVDACGKVAWQSRVVACDCVSVRSGADIAVAVAQDRVLLVLNAVSSSIDSFERETGSHLWHLAVPDLNGLDAGRSFVAFFPAVALDGTTYLSVTDVPSIPMLYAVAPNGTVKRLTDLAESDPEAGGLQQVSGMVLDSAGHVDVLFDDESVAFLAPSGNGLSQSRGCGKLLDPPTQFLAGASNVVSVNPGVCASSLGGPAVSIADYVDSWLVGAVIDANNDLYLAGPTLVSLDGTGAVRWPPVGEVGSRILAGPLLGENAVYALWVAQPDGALMPTGATLAAYDPASGLPRWSARLPENALPSRGPILLTTARQLVFVANDNVVQSYSAGDVPSTTAPWPTPVGAPDGRHAALGQ